MAKPELVGPAAGQAVLDGMPDIPDTPSARPRVPSAEVRLRIAYLHLTFEDAARILDVRARTLRDWASHRPAPAELGDKLDTLEEYTRIVERGVEAILEQHGALYAYQTDKELWTHQAHMKNMPASWWNGIVARTRHAHPEAPVTYWKPRKQQSAKNNNRRR